MFTDLEALGTWAIIIGGTLVVIVVIILVFRACSRDSDQFFKELNNVVRKAIRDETAARMGRSDLNWDCPECHEKNPNGTYTCEKCGYSLK